MGKDKIIDEINESECVYLQDGICTVSRGYYKQLKTKEQEIEQYKQALNAIDNIVDDYNRPQKTSQYYRDGFDEIQDIINKLGENNDK